VAVLQKGNKKVRTNITRISNIGMVDNT